ncbi:MAG TPA: hypothetical protein VN818_02605 [Gammaproteobacteria bacterium]|nr:hypothetical protein [Gammaproteobacteria bacterium]
MKTNIAGACLLLGVVSFAEAQPPAQPPAAPPVCTRAELKAAADSYVAAQKSGNVAGMAFADKVVFRENMADVAKEAGLWTKALPVALSRSFLDPVRCRTFTEVVVTEGDHQYVLGTRLYVDQRKITRVDSLVTDKGDWLFNANAYLKYSSAEDWSAPKPNQRVPAQELINAANSYLDLFSDKFVKTPWGIPCARLEGGAYTNRDANPNATCEVGIPPGVLYIVNRDYVVDEEQGVVNVYCRFGNSATGMPDSHTFRVVNGKLANVHTLSVQLNPDAPSPQADDNGAIVR